MTRTTAVAPPTPAAHLIAGEWVGEGTVERRNPARPDEVVALAPLGTAATVRDAVAAATDAQPAWRSKTGPERGAVLTRAAELLTARTVLVAHDLVREEGKTLTEATGEVTRAADVLRFFGAVCRNADGLTLPAGTPDTLVYTRREPLGVVGVVTPWNFPIAIPAWKIAPALAAGNAVVAKPAQLTTLSMQHLAQCLLDAGLPAGVLNLVLGAGSVVGDSLVSHPDVAAVSFTGSGTVGAGIHTAVSARMARVQLEMGGKNPLVVLDDADPVRAAAIAASGAFGLTGQACTATSRVIATPGIHDALVEELARVAQSYTPGDGLESGTRMGAVVSEAQFAADQRFVETARREGGEIVAGSGATDGLFHPAVVVTGVEPDHTIAQEEVFGPVLAVLRADDLDHATAIANGVRYGLTAGIVSNDMRAVHRFVDQVEAGVVKVNRPTSGLELNVPFGGTKESSTNTYREQGQSALDFYSWTKSVYLGVD
ncbi:acyl-CoA reductase-like NAD-dependent aldehyde dehydrogenase [Rhodococcus sp. 27YEA15]|uniref:aldehyde dehydrogenase family protein n=1 Tax=Rhodococcus sp. 27YEA15 TaxID=3156259 RepID=UPI003C799C6A